MPITSASSEEIASAGRAAMVEISSDGKIEAEFGKTYDFGKHWMLMDAFKRGFVRHLNGSGLSVAAFASFPILYAYAENNHLKKTFFLSDFKLMKRRYDTSTQAIRIPQETYSRVSSLQKANDRHLLIEVHHRLMEEGQENRDRFDFYALDPSTNASAFLGTLSGENVRLFFTKHGAVLFQNDELFWIAK